jgi:hypothetical protein
METDSNFSLISPGTLVELSEVSVDFSERNASVAKTRIFELLCSVRKNLPAILLSNLGSRNKTHTQNFEICKSLGSSQTNSEFGRSLS